MGNACCEPGGEPSQGNDGTITADSREVYTIVKDELAPGTKEQLEAVITEEDTTEAPQPNLPDGEGSQEVADPAASAKLEQLEEAKQQWLANSISKQTSSRGLDIQSQLSETRKLMLTDPASLVATRLRANRYGELARLPKFQVGKHVPILGLINPMSGAMAGTDILAVARNTAYYQSRMFNVLDVIRHKQPGGFLDVFRIELCKAKDEAAAIGVRPRLVSGGGDGTASLALFIVFLALKADDSRAEEGLTDTGNGFIWTDAEMGSHFPALAQLPLGSANDFANILGWGQKYPGDMALSFGRAATVLNAWFEAVIDPVSSVVNFDIWGLMPKVGDEVDFKLAELHGARGRCPNLKRESKREVHLRQANQPVPFLVCLYFSAGFGAYMTARFQVNRRRTPLRNRAEYVRQALGIMAESNPPQIPVRLEGVEVDCEEAAYFPPRRDKGTKGKGYREVGFYNINWQAHALHGADRASVSSRMGCGNREPVTFNDGKLDMFRWKFLSLLKNPGLKIQTDKKRDMTLKFAGGKGKGIFFQWDGEARFAFSPTGSDFHINIRRVMNVPVVLGPQTSPKLLGNVRTDDPVFFEFCGDTQDMKDAARLRTLKLISGGLDSELNATASEIDAANFPSIVIDAERS